MVITARFLCLVLAMLLFAVAAFWTPPTSRPVNLVSAGLALLALSFLLG